LSEWAVADLSSIPSRVDWGEIATENLDAQWALEQFFGKSSAEAEALFATNALYYGEALQSMSPVPFNFYARALAQYLMSDTARGDADGAASFLHTFAWVLETRPDIIDPDTKTTLLKTSEHVAANQAFYQASVSISKRFPEQLNRIKRLARRQSP
jgi:hypothetical protein